MAVRRFRFKFFILLAWFLLTLAILQFYFSRSKVGKKDAPISTKDMFASDKAEKSLPRLHSEVLLLNFQQTVYNTDKFGHHNPNAIILVVQVHSEIDYLRMHLESLRKVQNISKTTLVLSLSNYDNATFNLISGIDFCRYLKIVFPYSMDFFPDSFPGQDPNDCPRDIPKNEAIASNCNNAYFPDSYRHYREVKFVQMKHHWIWKLHMVFRGIRIFRNLQQPVAMLEGNQYVLPDFIHCIQKAVALRNERCPTCGLIGLGNSATSQAYTQSNLVDIFAWTSSKSAFGVAFFPDFYRQLVDVTDTMCEFDDYNWSWSLQAALNNQLQSKSLTLQLRSSRVLRVGLCIGMPTHSCTLHDEVEFIENQFKNQPLFPDQLDVSSQQDPSSKIVKPNGGWGDIRDQVLCKKYKTISETLKF